MEINDQNFQSEIEKINKPLLIDFFANWCQPCLMLSPALEKVSKELEEKIDFLKIDIDDFPQAAEKFEVSKIPYVVLLEKGKIIDSFLGVKSEQELKVWLLDNLKYNEALKWYENYAKENNLKLNPDPAARKRIIQGLLANEQKYGKRHCPCQRVEQGNEETVCPCVFHKKDIEEKGNCACYLFFK